MDIPHEGCQSGTCRYRADAPVRRGEHRGGRWGNIDDSFLHGCLIRFVVRIIIFCRIQTDRRNSVSCCLFVLLNTLWTGGVVFLSLACLLSASLSIDYPSNPNSNPDYLSLLSSYSEWLPLLIFPLSLYCWIKDGQIYLWLEPKWHLWYIYLWNEYALCSA